MPNIQILTNGKSDPTVQSTYWRRFNSDTNEWENTTLAHIVYEWTLLKFPDSGTDPLKTDVTFALMPFQDFQMYQVVIGEGETRYTLSHDVVWMADTEITFDCYFKSQDLGDNMPQLESLLTEIQSIWMNYNDHSINGLDHIVLNDRYVDENLMRRSKNSTYKKSLSVVASYYISRTTLIDNTIPTYDDPTIAGGFRTN
jgi:hypothetical protein